MNTEAYFSARPVLGRTGPYFKAYHGPALFLKPSQGLGILHDIYIYVCGMSIYIFILYTDTVIRYIIGIGYRSYYK